MSKLILIRGVSGSGKTTMAKKLIDGKMSSAHFEADMFFGYSYKFDPKLLPKAHSWCKLAVEHSMAWNIELIVVSNTFIRQWEMGPYLDLASDNGYDTEVITTPQPWDPAVLARRNLHGVPIDAIIRQINRFEDVL